MDKPLKIGIVGCGAIGSSLAKAIVGDFIGRARLVGLFDIDCKKSKSLSRLITRTEKLANENLKQLIAKSELVIESSSAQSSWNIAQAVLKEGRDIMIMSVGGVVSHLKGLSNLAKKFNAKVYIPSGAVSGIDALKAASLGKIKKVILTTRKNPRSFKGIRYLEKRKTQLDKINRDTLLYYGSAKNAVRLFPQNINVAAVLSIAGIGQNKTRVKIIASPGLKRNIHEIEIKSEAGRIFTLTENVLHPDNPKTSYLAVLSAIATLKNILTPICIGT